MRILKFVFFFLLIATAILGSIVSLNWTAFRTVFTNRSSLAEGSQFVPMTYSLAGLLEFAKTQPNYVSIHSFAFADSVEHLSFNSDHRNVMGDLQDFLLLLEAVRQHEAKDLFWDTEIDVAQILNFNIVPTHKPEIDELAEKRKITVKELVSLSLKHSTFAFSDALIEVLGHDNVLAIPSRFGINANPPVPSSAALLYWLENESDSTLSEKNDRIISLARQISHDPDFRNEARSKIAEIWPMTFDREKSWYNSLPKASVDDLLNPLLSALNGEFISEGGSKHILDFLRTNYPATQVGRGLTDYGAVFDTRLGQLSGIDFGTSEYTGERFASVVFFNQIPTGLWFHMSSNFMNQDFQQRLMWDPAFRSRALDSLSTAHIH